jgi:hypothetical protein
MLFGLFVEKHRGQGPLLRMRAAYFFFAGLVAAATSFGSATGSMSA